MKACSNQCECTSCDETPPPLRELIRIIRKHVYTMSDIASPPGPWDQPMLDTHCNDGAVARLRSGNVVSPPAP